MHLYDAQRHDQYGSALASIGDVDECVRGDAGQPIRILHVAQRIAGGVASYFEEIAAYQNDTFGKANVAFLVPSGSETHLPNIDPTQVLTFCDVSRRPGALLRFGRTARDTVAHLMPDIVHLHSSFAGAVVRAFPPPDGRKPRIVYSPHGWAFSMEVAGLRKLAYAAVEKNLAALTDAILVNSRSELDLALRFGLPAQKLRVIGNGIAWAAPAKKHAAAAEDRISIAFIGRHDPQKGLDVLLDAIDRFSLPTIQFHIVGESVVSNGSCGFSKTPDNVTFHGWLSRTEMLGLLERMDAVVMPSRWEAFGLVAAEAMRAGVPVIASNRGALPDVVEHGVGGYVFDIDDPDALGRLLQRLRRSELRQLGTSARRRWEREFVADTMNGRLLEAYTSVLNGQTSQRGTG